MALKMWHNLGIYLVETNYNCENITSMILHVLKVHPYLCVPGDDKNCKKKKKIDISTFYVLLIRKYRMVTSASHSLHIISLKEASSHFSLWFYFLEFDYMRYHRDMFFSTYDRDNDVQSANCAERHKGAWWYKKCFSTNINALYGEPWDTGLCVFDRSLWKHQCNITHTEMKMKPRWTTAFAWIYFTYSYVFKMSKICSWNMTSYFINSYTTGRMYPCNEREG